MASEKPATAEDDDEPVITRPPESDDAPRGEQFIALQRAATETLSSWVKSEES